jgi:hypothetical protein
MFLNNYAELKENVLSPSFKSYGSINTFFKTVVQTGYPFFVWNGKVYKVEDGQLGYIDTGKMMKDFE